MGRVLNVWSKKLNPRQSFTIAMQLMIQEAPDEALMRLAGNGELLTPFSKQDAIEKLKKRGYRQEGGVGKLPCDDCKEYVRIRQVWKSAHLCPRCVQRRKENWYSSRAGKVGRKPKRNGAKEDD